jgi:[ribosomal protein S5]-alanine N-acetyltransferase
MVRSGGTSPTIAQRPCVASWKKRKGALADTPREEKALATDRLMLEPLLPEHAALLFEGLADERLYRFIPQNAPESVETLEARYRRLSSRRSPDGSQVWLTFAMRLRERAIYLGTLEVTVFPDRSAYLAYTVFVPFWRQGYAREGSARMLRHLVEDHGVRVVTAEMDTRGVGGAGGVFGLRVGRNHVGRRPFQGLGERRAPLRAARPRRQAEMLTILRNGRGRRPRRMGVRRGDGDARRGRG